MNERTHAAGIKLARSLVFLGVIAGFAVSAPDIRAEPLRSRIEGLATERGFDLHGLERVGAESATHADGPDAADRIGRLLANYNFVILRDADGRVARLTIIGPRAAPDATPTAAPEPGPVGAGPATAERYVESVLTGPNGTALSLRAIVDTGASTLVLPRSLVARFGFSDRDLSDVRVQTANGMTDGSLGMLKSVRVGEAETDNVAVTFVEDRLLGGKVLLGMSFLGRFRMTIDGPGGGVHLQERRN